ncbi:MAG: hypothetical protein AMJ60_06750 [Desulfobacterales bacterium SG8_35]|jgi:Spy/CpxP family protein refolding chaperone|nr:MAG: hypothetical protein AMJ60_06750 [Desulfobacterales bacterium SG8_35]
MLRKNVWMAVALFWIFLPSALLAQEMMHGKWWQNKVMAEQLELTDSERKILDEKYTESRRKLIDLKSEVEKERLELDILLDSKEVNRGQIFERYDSLEEARAKLSKERFSLLIEVRDIIGIERFQELKLMHRDRDRERTKKRFRSGN